MYHYLRATKTNQLETKNIPSEKKDLEETLKTLQELDELDRKVIQPYSSHPFLLKPIDMTEINYWLMNSYKPLMPMDLSDLYKFIIGSF